MSHTFGVLEDEGLEDIEDFLLFAAWEFGSGLKELLSFSHGGLAFGFERSDTQEWIG